MVISNYDSYKQTNNIRPCILHGCGNYNLNSILKKLGYNISKVKYRNNLPYLLNPKYLIAKLDSYNKKN